VPNVHCSSGVAAPAAQACRKHAGQIKAEEIGAGTGQSKAHGNKRIEETLCHFHEIKPDNLHAITSKTRKCVYSSHLFLLFMLFILLFIRFMLFILLFNRYFFLMCVSVCVIVSV
jgi:hypothetical protein